MDKDLARHVAHIALASASRLEAATYALEKHCAPDELAVYRQAITKLTAASITKSWTKSMRPIRSSAVRLKPGSPGTGRGSRNR
jgi:hypothetical protein